MDVAGEGLEPVSDELHRPLQQQRHRHGGKVIRIGVDLDAERAADILANHPHRRFSQAELARIQVLHHVRGLLRVVDGQALVARVPVGDLAARLERHTGMAAEIESRFGHHRGAGKCRVDAAGIEAAAKALVVAELGVDQGRAGVERGAHLGRCGQGFPFDLQILQRVFGLCAGLGYHRHHRLALPAGAVDGQRILGCRFHAGQMAQRGDPGFADGSDFSAVEDAQHARHHAGKAALDADDAAMRDR